MRAMIDMTPNHIKLWNILKERTLDNPWTRRQVWKKINNNGYWDREEYANGINMSMRTIRILKEELRDLYGLPIGWSYCRLRNAGEAIAEANRYRAQAYDMMKTATKIEAISFVPPVRARVSQDQIPLPYVQETIPPMICTEKGR